MAGVEKVALGLRVVDDRKARLQLRTGRHGAQSFDSVVPGERVRVAKIDGIPVGRLKAPVEVAPDGSADERLDVFEAVERRRRKAVALEQAHRLPFHFGGLAELRKEGGAVGTLEKLRLVAEADPELVRIDFLVLARRIAAVFVLAVQLRV